jgi:tetratricopeptide (TPR) repeat protein
MKAHKTDRWFAEAYAAHQRGDLDEGERGYQRILRQQPGDAETLYLFGTIRLQQKRYPEAIKLLTRARKLRPRHPETLNNLGLALYETEEFAKARVCFEQAIAEKPDYTYPYNNLARILERDGSIDDAIATFTQAVELDSNYADAYYNLGLLLKKQDRFVEAEAKFCRALELAPGEARMWSDLGTTYKALGRLSEAERCTREALARESGRFDFWNNLGGILQEHGDFAGALTAYQQAETLKPEDPLPIWNQAYALLSSGRLAEGWIQHETRWGIYGAVSMPCPMWNGETLLGGTLVVLAEQGLGDEILFASCIPDTLRRASQVIVECAPRLAPIFVRSFPQALVVTGADRSNWNWLIGLPKPDWAVCGGSLPRWFRPDLESFPKTSAYLYADSERTAHWRERLAQLGEGLKIGICWRSGLRSGERYKHYTTLDDWMPLFAVPGVCFINLQYDDCAAELVEAHDRFGVNIVNFTELDLRNDQDELAALMSALDLVISAGTAVAELAGALGRPVWRFQTLIDWSSLGTEHIPWHPSVRLFNKTLDESWTPLFEQMAAELHQWLIAGPRQELPSVPVDVTAMTLAISSNIIGLALEARAAGQLEAAQRYCRQVLAEYPDQPDAWHLLGVVLRDLGAWEDAVSAFGHAHTTRPEDHTVLVNRGRTLQDLGRIESALNDFRAALDLDNASLDARLSLGELLDTQGQWEEAQAVLQPALTLVSVSDNPTLLSEVHYLLAQSLHHQRRLTEAESHLHDALRLNPNYPGAHNGLGNIFREQSRLEEALSCYQTALALRPDLPEFYNNLGNALRELNRLREAEAAYREALRLRPDYADTWSNLGNLLIERNANREALEAYRRALELRPDDTETHWNISYSLLQAGELTEGWAAYEWRWRTGMQGQLLQWYPNWNGENLTGRSLLVLPEQGLGDEIMFASCLPDVLARAGQVVLVCQQRLAVLYARSFPTALIVAMPAGIVRLSTDLPVCDFQVAVGSLPRLLRAQIEDFPTRPAYLLADPTQSAQWRTRLNTLGSGLKIGICWRSGLRIGERHRYYPTLIDWEPILKTAGVIFINLQYDDCVADLSNARTQFGIEIVNFPDLDLRDDQCGVAALITALDGVISAPTAVAELAAALGRPVLRYVSDWTSLGTDYMPWHPTMRLFHKPDLEQPWTSTMNAIAAALGEWVTREVNANNASIEVRSRLWNRCFEPPRRFAPPLLIQGGEISPLKPDCYIPFQLAETHLGSMLVAGNSAAVQHLLQTGEHAPEAIALLASLLRPGDWMVEASAGIGAFTLPLARAVGTDGMVIACESHRDEFRLLCANLALNGIDQVHAECLTLSTATPAPVVTSGSTWLQARAARFESVDGLNLPRCDLLRIGEGAEALAVLNGARATLDRFKPFIHIETCVNPKKVGEWLRRIGYAWQEQTRANQITDILGYPK